MAILQVNDKGSMRFNVFNVLLVVAAVAGCVSQVSFQQTGGATARATLPDGTWTGTLDWTIKPDGSKVAGHDFAIGVCGGKMRHWYKDEKGEWFSPDVQWTIRSGPDSHTMQYIDQHVKQPDWVEIQSFTLLEIDDKTAAVQWSRAVNNRDLAVGQADRTFFYYGAGTFKRIRTGCATPPHFPY